MTMTATAPVTPEEVFTDFDPMNEYALDHKPLEYQFRPVLFWRVANGLAGIVGKATDGQVRVWLKDKVKDGSDEQFAIGAEAAQELCSLLTNRAHFLRRDLEAAREPAGSQGWKNHWKIYMVAISLKWMYQRAFDDWSLAFYAATILRLPTLEHGYEVVEGQYRDILDAIERSKQ